ncbi:MAG: hypothetical protein ACJ786_37295 [Catenulispora sp.]
MTETPNTAPEPAKPTPPAPEAAPVPQEQQGQPEQELTAESPWIAPEDDTESVGIVGIGEFGTPADPNAPDTGVAAAFLPGIEAASILALLLSLLAAGAYLLVHPLVQARDANRTWSDFKNNVPRARQDPFGIQRDWIQYQSWTHIVLGLVAILVALLVLGLWTAQKNRLYSRAFAQAALVLGLAVVLYGILLKTGAIGAQIPSMKEIGGALSSQQQ